jgi:hypothetical protein
LTTLTWRNWTKENLDKESHPWEEHAVVNQIRRDTVLCRGKKKKKIEWKLKKKGKKIVAYVACCPKGSEGNFLNVCRFQALNCAKPFEDFEDDGEEDLHHFIERLSSSSSWGHVLPLLQSIVGRLHRTIRHSESKSKKKKKGE